ncbi:hypothetical protein V1517DRAFT_337709 [Lipomyces orientalis]|uniref:Uncharacterized protein n=1 Tax=Lipomyces orientalis TaxID=1233043 RepID=A0ACC3TTK5_9ASCO
MAVIWTIFLHLPVMMERGEKKKGIDFWHKENGTVSAGLEENGNGVKEQASKTINQRKRD